MTLDTFPRSCFQLHGPKGHAVICRSLGNNRCPQRHVGKEPIQTQEAARLALVAWATYGLGFRRGNKDFPCGGSQDT